MNNREYNSVIKNKISDEIKRKICTKISKRLINRFDRSYIIGSFLKKNWDYTKSDIDLIIIDTSFEHYPLTENMKIVKSSLRDLDFQFDIYLYTWNQFESRLEVDTIFKNNIIRGLMLS